MPSCLQCFLRNVYALSVSGPEMNCTKIHPADGTDAWLVGVTERAGWPKETLSREKS